MPSQFFGLNIAYSGLTASNAALNTTSNNIANVETKGYSRQNAEQAAANALRVFTTYGCAGAGVDVIAIERVRDHFYDVKYWDNNSNTGEYNMKQYYMKQVEDYFNDDSTIEGFKTIFDDMMTALGEVAKQSGSDTTKAQFIGYASNLTQYFNSMSANMSQVQKDIEKILKLNHPVRTVTGFDRPNLFFDVIHPELKDRELKRLLAERKGKSGIVYCSTRKKVETVCENLQTLGYQATRYHAGLEESERKKNQEDFLYYDKVQPLCPHHLTACEFLLPEICNLQE